MLSDNDEIIGDQTVPFAQLSVLGMNNIIKIMKLN